MATTLLSYVFGSGGASSGGGFNLVNTVGQHDAITSSSALFPFVGGFFNEASLAAATPAGSNVSISLANVSITFAGVTSAGTTTVTATSTQQDPPVGFSFAGLTFDITTTAAFTAPITVCFAVPAITDPAVFFNLRLLHSEGGVLVDRTISLDFTAKTVCGQVSSLSPFALARPVEPQDSKRAARDALLALRVSPNLTQSDAVRLDDAIRQLSASLDPAMWTDGFHLKPAAGDQDFDEEKQAAGKIRELLDDAKSSVAPTTLRQVIRSIVGADRMLALTAINDAVAANGDRTEIANARSEFAKGDADLATSRSDRFESAIDHYREAWRHALKAIGKS